MVKSFVDKKYKKLSDLNNQSTSAISMITDSIDKLEIINQMISNEIVEIESAQAQLSDTKTGLAETKDKNSKIMNRLLELIGE